MVDPLHPAIAIAQSFLHSAPPNVWGWNFGAQETTMIHKTDTAITTIAISFTMIFPFILIVHLLESSLPGFAAAVVFDS